MTDEENEEGGVTPPAAPNSFHSHNETTYRDVVADRTGDLLRESVAVAREFRKPDVVGVIEPDTKVSSLVVIKPDGSVDQLSPSVFDAYRGAPKRMTGVAKMTRLESFIDHVNRFKQSRSALFAVEEKASLYAIFDYNSVNDATGDPLPAFGGHRVAYDFPLSEEWKAWNVDNGRKMDLGQFAEFLEDRIVDVDTVDLDDLNTDMQRFIGVTEGKIGTPTKLVELSRGLRINEESTVTDIRNISSGEGQISFSSEHSDSAGAPLSIPTVFVICIPVFARSTDFYRLVCRLRYRKSLAGVTFWYEIWRADRVFDVAFTEAIEAARDQTGLPLFIGTHEVRV
ncbi:MAG: hypothetical protein C0429_06825 [Sphingopyxis sp.]|nr:hypothetical protein [Sphingopyxis sp.]